MPDLALYTDEHWGFSFPFPASWETSAAEPGDIAVVVLGEPGTEGFRPNLVATVIGEVESLESWTDQSERNLSEDVPLWRVLERVRIEDRPDPTLLTTSTLAGPAGESLTQLIWNVLRDGLGFSLTATCHTWDFPGLRALFMELFAGVEPPRSPEEH